jgi:hypothetical protein
MDIDCFCYLTMLSVSRPYSIDDKMTDEQGPDFDDLNISEK